MDDSRAGAKTYNDLIMLTQVRVLAESFRLRDKTQKSPMSFDWKMNSGSISLC